MFLMQHTCNLYTKIFENLTIYDSIIYIFFVLFMKHLIPLQQR